MGDMAIEAITVRGGLVGVAGTHSFLELGMAQVTQAACPFDQKPRQISLVGQMAA